MDTSDGWQLEPGGQVRGTLALPGDKSISHRAFLIAALAEGTSRLEGVLDSEDCRATAHALAQTGRGYPGSLARKLGGGRLRS